MWEFREFRVSLTQKEKKIFFVKMTTKKLDESMMREMFNVADTNKDNTLSLSEFETFLEQQGGVRVEHMRIKSMFDEVRRRVVA